MTPKPSLYPNSINNNNEKLKKTCQHTLPLSQTRRSSIENETVIETEVILQKTTSTSGNENTNLSRRRSVGKEIDPLIPGPSFTESV